MYLCNSVFHQWTALLLRTQLSVYSYNTDCHLNVVGLAQCLVPQYPHRKSRAAHNYAPKVQYVTCD